MIEKTRVPHEEIFREQQTLSCVDGHASESTTGPAICPEYVQEW
jgi:hypothetical protein